MLATISDRGQITIPKKIRSSFRARNYQIEKTKSGILLKPVFVIPEKSDLADFSSLAESSLDFWKKDEDDIYQEFYQ